MIYKETLFTQKLLLSTLVIVVVSSLVIILAANPLHSAYSINPTNPTDDVIKGSISSISNDPSNSSIAWISTGVYKMENVKTSPTFNSTFYMIRLMERVNISILYMILS